MLQPQKRIFLNKGCKSKKNIPFFPIFGVEMDTVRLVFLKAIHF